MFEIGLHLNERGNTLLATDDNMVAWLTLEGNLRLEVSWTPDNYPALHVRTVELTDEEIAKHIRQNCGGWYVRRLNIDGVQTDRNNEVIGEVNYDDMTNDDEARILAEIVAEKSGRELLRVGDVASILREELNNAVLNEIDPSSDHVLTTEEQFTEVFQKMVHEMPAAELLSYGDVYTELREEYNNEILDRWEKEQQ